MHHSFFFFLQNLVHGSPINKHQRKVLALRTWHGVPWAAALMRHSPKQQPNPFQSLWKQSEIIITLLLLVAQTSAWNIKGRRHLLGRQHSNHLGLWRQKVKNNISSQLSGSPVFPSSPPSGSELQELRSFDVNLSDTLVSSPLCPALFFHTCTFVWDFNYRHDHIGKKTLP